MPSNEELLERIALLEGELSAARRRAAPVSEGHYQILADDVPDLIYSLDGSGNVVTVNGSALVRYGFGEHEFNGKPFLGFVHAEDSAVVVQSFLEGLAVRREVTSGLEFRLVARDGESHWCELHARARFDAEGNYAGEVGVLRDITDRKRAAEVAENEKLKLASVIGAMTSDLTIRDRDFRLIYQSPSSVARFGDRTGKQCHMVFQPLETVCRSCPCEQVFRDGKTHTGIADVTLPDGIITHWEIVATPIRDSSGSVVSCLEISTDVTERRRSEEEKARLERQLQQAQKMESVGRLAGGVAHDFNNMLSVILGHAEMALDGLDPSHPLHDDLTEIREAASRSADLTRQLLAFARKQTIMPRSLDLNDAVAGMLKMLQRLIGENIELRWERAAAPLRVHMDPSQIDQLLANLCVNARDAISGVGTMTIETRACTVEDDLLLNRVRVPPGEYVQLTVRDDGCGMDADTMAHLFEPFFTTKPTGKGTGLGLATVYGIVKQNQGLIDVESAPTRGTTFTILLPRHGATETSARTVAAAPDGGQETILLVEDEPGILRMTTKMLAMHGYTVLAASTPAEAIRLAVECPERIHLILSDVVMPEMNGRDLATTLLSRHGHMKALFTSGYTADVIAPHGGLGEGVSFIQKPFTRDDLAAKVREVLDRR
ncbi:MAG: PAS domain S-box protein [Deltaproteobacteria bacterium]